MFDNEKNLSVDLGSIPQDQLVSFYGLLFAAAHADNEVLKQELEAIYENIDLDILDDKHKDIVKDYIINPPNIDDCLKNLSDICDELRYAIVISVCEVILADDYISNEEEEFLDKICLHFGVTNEQREAIINFIKEGKKVLRNEIPDNKAEKVIKNAISGLTAVGVPITAIYFSGTVIGLSAAGITSGLAALGLGLGMLPGIGVAVLMGTAIFIILKKMLGDSREEIIEKAKIMRERKMQKAIKNLQEMINLIMDRIADLEKKGEIAEKNKEAIEILRKRLESLLMVLRRIKEREEGLNA